MKLMINNYVSFIDRSGEIHIPQTHPLKVMDISLFKVEVCQIDELFAQVERPIVLDNRDVCGVPLTEDWLLKFGFEYDFETGTYSVLRSLENIDYLFELEYLDNEIFVTLNNVEWNYKHVHQLQNLYYSLTQTELEIK